MRLLPWKSGLAGMTLLALAACGGGGGAGTQTEQASSASAAEGFLAHLSLPETQMAVQLPASLAGRTGEVDVWLQLEAAPVAAKRRELRPDAPGVSWKSGDAGLKEQLRAYKAGLVAKQDTISASLAASGAKELGRVQVAHNAIAVRVDASKLRSVAALPGVVAVRPVRHYELMLSETVPYIGAAAAQANGQRGAGVRVAVLDSGVDYTHRNLGGAGTAAAYAAAWGASVGDAKQTTRDGLFPTAKVVDGYDFVGEAWTGGAGSPARTEDSDPIDFEGHGTHVADIIAGVGPNKGVAPGASIIAVKVCSAVASSCNGVALLKGMDFAIDPNGDGDIGDAADVINMSLGSSYGQEEDDLSLAATQAVKLGVMVVVSAGNSGNRPYITGSPSTASGTLSVAQTQVPGAVALPLVIQSPAAIAGIVGNTNTVDWAPIGAGFSGTVKLASQTGAANNLACTTLAAGSLAGRVALIDRGTCSISVKVHNAAVAGAIGVLIANNAPGDPPSFSFGGPTPFTAAPTLIITQADGARIKANINAPVVVSVSAANAISLAGSMASTSSRGPGFSDSALKPEIGAPGASVSAEVATGTGETAFGGTSGAAPMVAGSAAILRAANPDMTPLQIKALLMNSASTQVYTNPATQPGVLAPVSRIGAGEVRVNRALALKTIAYNPEANTAALPFGFVEVGYSANLASDLVIQNLGTEGRTYNLTSNYRYAADAAAGATTLEYPATVHVAAGGTARVKVRMVVDGTKLPAWGFASAGATGGTGALLEGNEVDGYLSIAEGGETVTVPFHALLRKSASMTVVGDEISSKGDIRLQNNGVNAGEFDLFALTGTSPQVPASLQAQPGDNIAVIDLRAVGVRAVDASTLQFAVSRWDRRSHPAYPAGIEIYIDNNRDGVDDFVIYNIENGAFASSGQTVVGVANLRTGTAQAYYFLDADLQSRNGIFTVPMAAVGLTAATKFNFSVYAWDDYFSGEYTDAITGMTYTAGTPRYAVAGGVLDGGLAAGQMAKLPVAPVAGGASASPSQSGFLVLYRQNLASEMDIVNVRP